MGLLERLSREDDPIVTAGIHKEFGNVLYYLGVFRSVSKENVLWTLIFYSCTTFLFMFFISIFLVTVYLSISELANVITLIHLTLLLLLASVSTHAVSMKKLSIDILYRYFYGELNGFFYTYDSTSLSLLETRNKFSKMITRVVTLMILSAGVTVVILEPLLKIILGEDNMRVDGLLYEIPIPMYWPIDHDNYLLSFILPTLLQLLLCGVAAAIISGAVLIYLNYCLHIFIQLKVLLHNIKTLDEHVNRSILQDFEGAHVKFSSSSRIASTYYKKFIQDIVQHHVKLIDCFKHVNNAGKWIFLVLFLSGGIDIAMAGIMVFFIKGRLATKIAAVFISITEIFMFAAATFASDLLTNMSLEIYEEIYMLNWYSMSEEVKKSLQIIMTSSQRPLCFKAGDIIPVDKEMFSSMMQSAYSFINLIAAVKSE